jgi:hypothetical protein
MQRTTPLESHLQVLTGGVEMHHALSLFCLVLPSTCPQYSYTVTLYPP